MPLTILIPGDDPIYAIGVPQKTSRGLWIPTIAGKPAFLYLGEELTLIDEAFKAIVEAFANKSRYVYLFQ
jgi:hypothetical protein